MKQRTFLHARVAGLFIGAALLAGCYAPLVNQMGYLDLTVSGSRSTNQDAIVLVVNADYKDSFKELLYLIDKGQDAPGAFSSSDTTRLTELAAQMASSGLVKFGGFPFFVVSMDPNSQGSFEIPGIPAGRDYLVKFFVFQTGFSFKVENIDSNLGSHISDENLVFSNNENYNSGVPFQNWTVLPGQQVTVKAGETASLNVGTLGPRV